MKTPAECRNMAELRAGIDALDARIVAMLAERARYIDRAAALKPGEGLPARIDDRVEAVVANVRAAAVAGGWDADLAEELWRRMIDWSITREERLMGGKG